MKIIKITSTIILLTLLIFACKTTDKKAVNKDDFELMFNEALASTNRGNYYNSIIILKELNEKYQENEFMSINYNIGYNYYKLNNFDEAKRYFHKVINYFENTKLNQDKIEENRKFIVLSEAIIDRINKLPEIKKDPYRVKEDLENRKNKKIKIK